MKKTRILYIINNLNLGGAEKMLLSLINGLDKEKYEIGVATITGDGPLLKGYEESGAKLYINNKKSKIGFGVIGALKKNIKDFKPDIVHTHLFAGDTWGRIAAILLGKKLIISNEHGINKHENALQKSVKHFLSYFTSVIVAASQGMINYAS